MTSQNDKNWEDILQKISSNNDNTDQPKFGTQTVEEGTKFKTEDIQRGFKTKDEFFEKRNKDEK